MTGVRHLQVGTDEAENRLDRWFRRRFPELSHVRLQKLLRTGQVRVDGKRAKASDRLAAGMEIRVPPFGEEATPRPPKREPAPPSEADAAWLRSLVLYRDDDVIVLNKPHGLAVQGGTGTSRHLDGMLDALAAGGDRPRLVHRLDRDTSGVLLLARSARAAAALTRQFRARDTLKLYWAVTVGVPSPRRGRIDLALGKTGGRGFERVAPDVEDAKSAVTDFAVVEAAGRRLAWVALRPLTGRTHQLRAHLEAIGTPILGDGKYGAEGEFVEGMGLSPALHLHARAITLPHPSGRGVLSVAAPLPDHMRATFAAFNFDADGAADPFAEA